MAEHQFYKHGKLLLSGEYLVLDGALGVAVPTLKGQHFSVSMEKGQTRRIYWKSLDDQGVPWLEVVFDHYFNILQTNQKNLAEKLQAILVQVALLNPGWLADAGTVEVNSHLEFNRKWGLGSSSTLIAFLAEWAEINAYELLETTIGGSGYDLACANAEGLIAFKRSDNEPEIEQLHWNPEFLDDLFLVYRGEKQHTSKEIVRYQQLDFNREQAIQYISALSKELLSCTTLSELEQWIETHETALSKWLTVGTVKSHYRDYPGALKSLGAWGGDFMLATRKDALDYFPAQGLSTVVPFLELVRWN